MNTHAHQEISHVVALAVKDLSPSPSEREIQRRIYDVRRTLIDKAMLQLLSNKEHSDEEKLQYEDILRDSLPSMIAPATVKKPHFSAWRSALVAILGLFFGSAVGQSLSAVQMTTQALPFTASPVFSASTAVLCSIMGVMALLWFTEWLVRCSAQNYLRMPWGKVSWKMFSRIFIVVWCVLLAITVGRDFLTGQTVLINLLESFGIFLRTGQLLGVFTNGYGLLIFFALMSMLIKRPLYFEKEDFEQRLDIAAQNWWACAQLATQLILENKTLKNDELRETWQKVGRDLYSLAGELPEARGRWMQERLRRLGMEAPREDGLLKWSLDLQERYTPLGHLEQGDSCFVDEPPILENGALVRKGTVRKVRHQ